MAITYKKRGHPDLYHLLKKEEEKSEGKKRGKARKSEDIYERPHYFKSFLLKFA